MNQTRIWRQPRQKKKGSVLFKDIPQRGTCLPCVQGRQGKPRSTSAYREREQRKPWYLYEVLESNLKTLLSHLTKYIMLNKLTKADDTSVVNLCFNGSIFVELTGKERGIFLKKLQQRKRKSTYVLLPTSRRTPPWLDLVSYTALAAASTSPLTRW